MIERLLRTASLICSAVVVVSFVLFAVDEARGASKASVAGVSDQPASTFVDPSPRQEAVRQREHGTARELLDDADDDLLAPFAGLTDSSGSAWARRGVPALVALLVYGFGLSFLARFSRGRQR